MYFDPVTGLPAIRPDQTQYVDEQGGIPVAPPVMAPVPAVPEQALSQEEVDSIVMDEPPAVPGAPVVPAAPVQPEFTPPVAAGSSVSVGSTAFSGDRYAEIEKLKGTDRIIAQARADAERAAQERADAATAGYGTLTPEGLGALGGTENQFGTGAIGAMAWGSDIDRRQAQDTLAAQRAELDAMQRAAEAQQAAWGESQNQARMYRERLEQRLNAVASMTVNPKNVYESMSGLERGLTGVAIAAQAILGMQGYNIDVMGQINRRIDRDIEAQKHAIATGQWASEQDKMLYDMVRAEAADDQMALREFGLARLAQMKAATALVTSQFAGERAAQQGAAAIAAIDGQIGVTLSQIQKDLASQLENIAQYELQAKADSARTAVQRAQVQLDRDKFNYAVENPEKPDSPMFLFESDPTGDTEYPAFILDPEKVKTHGASGQAALDSWAMAETVGRKISQIEQMFGENGKLLPTMPLVENRLDNDSSFVLRAALTELRLELTNGGLIKGNPSDADQRLVDTALKLPDKLDRASAEAGMRLLSRWKKNAYDTARTRISPLGRPTSEDERGLARRRRSDYGAGPRALADITLDRDNRILQRGSVQQSIDRILATSTDAAKRRAELVELYNTANLPDNPAFAAEKKAAREAIEIAADRLPENSESRGLALWILMGQDPKDFRK